MRNVVVTAGGTSEHIDTVRKITNSSSGRLGAKIAGNLNFYREKYGETRVFYIHTPGAAMPEVYYPDNFAAIEVTDTIGLRDAVLKVLAENRIDWFIHSMAVSDYIVHSVTTAEKLASYLDTNGATPQNIVENTNVLDRSEKISSYEENLLVTLVKAPKVINLVKKVSPATKLIGFKLLTDVPVHELVDAAKDLMEKNDCEYVVANDLMDITETAHIARIIGRDGSTQVAGTKDEIADILFTIVNESKD